MSAHKPPFFDPQTFEDWGPQDHRLPYVPDTRWEAFRRWLDAWYWVIRERLHLGRWEPK